MVGTILKRALGTLKKKPIKLWAFTWLVALFEYLAMVGAGMVPVLALCIILLLEVGMTMVFLHGYRGEEIAVVQIFDAFKGGWKNVKRILIGLGWTALWIFLWAIIPVVGPVFAIIRSYEYRLVPYILVQEPDVDPLQAMNISKERTKGYVGKMFLTDLVVVGLIAAVAFAFELFVIIFGAIGIRVRFFLVLAGIFTFLMVLSLIVIGVFVPLLTGIIQAAYYEEITNPTIDATTGKTFTVCPGCGAKVGKDVAFCPTCGTKIPKEEAPVAEAPVEAPAVDPTVCPNCGAKLEDGAAFCASCGTKVN